MRQGGEREVSRPVPEGRRGLAVEVWFWLMQNARGREMRCRWEPAALGGRGSVGSWGLTQGWSWTTSPS